MPTQEENSYIAELEAARLEESLNEQEEDDQAPAKKSGSLAGSLQSKSSQAKKKFNAAAKAVATGQYAVWQAMWEFLVPTFGLSLFLIYVPLSSWIFKKTFPESVSQYLPEPGEDGTLFAPPPTPGTENFLTPLYGLINKIAMLGLPMILAFIVMFLILMIVLPPLLILETARAILGPLGERIYHLLMG